MSKMLLTLSLAAAIGLLACQDDITAPTIRRHADIVPQDPVPVTVMTRNIYLGFDIDQVLAGNMDLETGLGELMATWFPTRAQMLATEIATTQPDLIGLQEVVTWDIGSEPMNFLEILMATLDAYGLHYKVVANNKTTDVTVPVDPVIRYRDYDVILARDDQDVEIGTVTTQIYDAMLSFTLFNILPGTRPMGFVAVEAKVDGVPFVFASTHLETQNYPEIQLLQAKQLINWTKHQKLPVVLVGDLNSAANNDAPADKYTRTYGRLLSAGSFVDLWSAVNPNEAGLTCCFEPTLSSTSTAFDQRLDLILLDSAAMRLMSDPTITIVGLTDRGVQPRWASDHAGVVASFKLGIHPED